MLVWGPDSRVVAAHALWFGPVKATVNCAEMAALVWGLEWLVKLNVEG